MDVVTCLETVVFICFIGLFVLLCNCQVLVTMASCDL